MNQKRAKRIRKMIYGSEFSPRFRQYKKDAKTGAVTADRRRQQYQATKGRRS